MCSTTGRRATVPDSEDPPQSRLGSGVGCAWEVPVDFVELVECLPSNLDRQLGYFGGGRFVAFHYEPRADDVIWRDERSFGIGTGAWQTFGQEVQPLAEMYDVNLGSNQRAADHVLVFDRVRLTAYFAPKSCAEAFLTRREALVPAGRSGGNGRIAIQHSIVA